MFVGVASARLCEEEDGAHSSRVTHKEQVIKKCYQDVAGFLWLASPLHFCIEFRHDTEAWAVPVHGYVMERDNGKTFGKRQ